MPQAQEEALPNSFLQQSRRDILASKVDGGVSRNMSHMQLDQDVEQIQQDCGEEPEVDEKQDLHQFLQKAIFERQQKSQNSHSQTMPTI